MGIAVGSLLNGAIQLESDGVAGEGMRAFVRLFEVAWSRIPLQYQILIENYWRGRVVPEDCREKPDTNKQYDPKISVYDDTRRHHEGAPRVFEDGHVILFPAQLLADMGEELAVVAVTHELAHVSFCATSEPNHWPDHKTAETYDAAEHLVDKRLVEWGFAQHTLDKLDFWMAERDFPRFEGKKRGEKVAS
jgi:hypothetical protein